MHIVPSTAPGVGTVYQGRTRHGEEFGVVLEDSGSRTLLFYDRADPDTPAHRVVLDEEEADRLADLLSSRSVSDRLEEIERRLDALSGGGKPGDR